MKNDLVSLIITCCDNDETLDKCINSVLNQTYSNIELLLVNNGSKDNTASICNKWYSQDSRVQVYHIGSTTDSQAKIFALNHLRGNHYCFVKPDECINSDYIEKWLAEIYSSKSIKFNSNTEKAM